MFLDLMTVMRNIPREMTDRSLRRAGRVSFLTLEPFGNTFRFLDSLLQFLYRGVNVLHAFGRLFRLLRIDKRYNHKRSSVSFGK